MQGEPGYHKIDERRRESQRAIRSLRRSMLSLENFLNPELRSFRRQKKRNTKFVDLTNYEKEETISNHSSTSEN